MNEYKILFTGPMRAGKSSAIACLSETAPVITDVTRVGRGAAGLTAGFDDGLLTLGSGDRLRLLGTPGLRRFDALWSILARNALGLVMLTDNLRPDPLADLAVYLDGFSQQLRSVPCVIGVGRLDNHPSPDLDDYARFLQQRALVLPVLGCDARNRADVVALMDALLVQMEAFALRQTAEQRAAGRA